VAAVGDVLGRYELVEEIGEGGMATVFRARDRELRRDVAIKVMFPHLAKREETVRRFQREARAAAGLEHPNILRIYDVGGEGEPYIVMELVRGRTLLAEIEQRGAMLAEVAACVGALLADALAVAHKAGVIHRDIKPANVLIASDGRVLLADFGVARLETADSLVTRTGALLGTPAYMSPEQASGDIASARSDLYSLGATLYQLATGALPYAGTPAKVMSLIAAGQLVAPVKRRAAVGPELSAAIVQMMGSEPEERPASALAVASELRAIAKAGGLGEPADEVAAYLADPEAFSKARVPAIVEAVIAASERALVEKRLPRAMALADRASALAPSDVRVAALVDRVLAGGRAGQRRKAVVVGLAGLVLVGGAAAGMLSLRGGEPAVVADAARPRDAALDARARDAAIDAPVDAPADATGRARDAGVRPRDAAIHVDAGAVTLAIDASIPVDAPAVDARLGTLTVDNDTWCNVKVDGVLAGKRGEPISVRPGHHVVRCEQSAERAWTKEIDVAAGASVHLAGNLLGTIDVKFAVDADLDGVLHHAGETVHVPAMRHTLGGAWRDLRASCTVRATPELDCYP
jgi:serine/threonine-protein kinase